MWTDPAIRASRTRRTAHAGRAVTDGDRVLQLAGLQSTALIVVEPHVKPPPAAGTLRPRGHLCLDRERVLQTGDGKGLAVLAANQKQRQKRRNATNWRKCTPHRCPSADETARRDNGEQYLDIRNAAASRGGRRATHPAAWHKSARPVAICTHWHHRAPVAACWYPRIPARAGAAAPARQDIHRLSIRACRNRRAVASQRSARRRSLGRRRSALAKRRLRAATLTSRGAARHGEGSAHAKRQLHGAAHANAKLGTLAWR